MARRQKRHAATRQQPSMLRRSARIPALAYRVLPYLRRSRKFHCHIAQPGTSLSRSANRFITSGRAQSTSPSAMKRGVKPASNTTVEGSVSIFHALATERDGKRHRIAREEAAHGAVGLGHADGNDCERPALEPGLQLSEACHFRPTRLAPGGKEMDEHDPAAKPGELV